MGKKNNKKQGHYNWNTGAYNNMTNTQLDGIKLPELIHCDFCKKDKNFHNFSKKEHATVRAAIIENGQRAPRYQVRCIICSGGQMMEMKCQDCTEWKDLDLFAKTHRKGPDNATCKDCMDERLDFDPALIQKSAPKVDSDSDDDSDEVSDEDDEDTESDSGSDMTATNVPTASLAGTMNSLSVNETTTGSEASSRATASSYFPSYNSTNGGSVGGVPLDVHRYGVPRSRTTAAASSTASNDNRKFPKIKAHRPTTTASSPYSSTAQQADDDSDEEAVPDYSDDDDDDD